MSEKNDGFDPKGENTSGDLEKKPEKAESFSAKDYIAMLFGSVCFGAGLGVAKEVWKAQGPKIKEAGGGLIDHLIDGCMSKAREKIDEALGVNQKVLESKDVLFGERKSDVSQTNSSSGSLQEDFKDATIIDVESVEVTDTFDKDNDEDEGQEQNTFESLLKRDLDLRIKFGRLTEANEKSSENFIKSLPKEKQGKVASLMVEILLFEQDFLQKEARTNNLVEVEGKTVPAEDYELLKAEFLKLRELSDKLQWKLAGMIVQ